MAETLTKDDSFGLADEQLDALCDQLDQEGVDVPALLQALAGIDPDRQMRRYRAVTLRLLEIEARYAAEAEALKTWREARSARLKQDLAFIGSGLEAAARLLKEKTGRKKLDGPWGYVQLRTPQASLVIDDEVAATQALVATGRSDCVKATLLKGPAKKLGEAVLATIPGLHLETPAEDTASIHPRLPQEASDANPDE